MIVNNDKKNMCDKAIDTKDLYTNIKVTQSIGLNTTMTESMIGKEKLKLSSGVVHSKLSSEINNLNMIINSNSNQGKKKKKDGLRISVEGNENNKYDFHGFRSSTVGRKCKLSSECSENRKCNVNKPQTSKRCNIKGDNASDIFRLEDASKREAFLNMKSPKFDGNYKKSNVELSGNKSKSKVKLNSGIDMEKKIKQQLQQNSTTNKNSLNNNAILQKPMNQRSDSNNKKFINSSKDTIDKKSKYKDTYYLSNRLKSGKASLNNPNPNTNTHIRHHNTLLNSKEKLNSFDSTTHKSKKFFHSETLLGNNDNNERESIKNKIKISSVLSPKTTLNQISTNTSKNDILHSLNKFDNGKL